MVSGIGVAIGAALVWGGYLFYLKRAFEDYPASLLTVSINSFALVWYLPVFLVGVGPRGASDALRTFGVDEIAVVALTATMVAAAMIAFLRALAVGEVSYVAPISKIVPVFVLPIEVIALGQVLTPLEVAGVVVATAAVYVANFRGGALLDPLRRAATSTAARLALLSAMAFAVSDVARRVGLQELAIPVGLWVPLLLGGVAVVLLPSALGATTPATFRADLPKLAVGGLFVAAGEGLTNVAFSLVPASIASPIINTQAVVAVVLGGLLLDEQQFGIRLVAAGLAVIGVTMIAV
jgi:drug/metabolite transporter (DMT)-like permease